MKLFEYKLKLNTGKDRTGILIKLDEGKWGEVAPLQPWSKETLQEAVTQLKNVSQTSSFYPSVAFGMESAKAAQADPITLPVAALLMGTKEEILLKAQQCIADGFTHAKLKIAGLSLDDAFRIVSTLKDRLRLRIDVNRLWSLTDSLAFFSQFTTDAFDYIEEPVSNPKDLTFFSHPFALDETARDHRVEPFLHLKNLKAFIFKPTLHGGLSVLNKLISYGKPIVLSSFFESGVGIFNIASLLQRTSLPILPLGIDTYRFFEKDLLKNPLIFKSGKLILPSFVEPDASFLNEL